MVLWINLNHNNRSVLASQYSVLREKIGPILPPLGRLTAGREGGKVASRRNTGGFQNFITSIQVKLLGLLFCLMLLQLYCSFRTAFSWLLSS